MNLNKFQKIKIDKEKNYRIEFKAGQGIDATFYEQGKDIIKTKTHLLCKTFMKKKIHHKNVINMSKKNFTTLYEKIGLIPPLDYNLKEMTVTGKPFDYSNFEKAKTRKQAIERIDKVVNKMNRNFRLNKASMERLA